MSKIRSLNTKPELLFKIKKNIPAHPKGIFGNPDFIDYKKKIVYFIDGCFWHKCSLHYKEPKSNKDYWNKKIERNCLRDKEVNICYKNSNWKVIRIWEHELKHQ